MVRGFGRAHHRGKAPLGGVYADALSVSLQARVANIGLRERKRRLRFGLAAGGLSLIAAVWLIASAASPGWRLALFVPLFLAALGYFQARDRT